MRFSFNNIQSMRGKRVPYKIDDTVYETDFTIGKRIPWNTAGGIP
jgi:hypothetical protein